MQMVDDGVFRIDDTFIQLCVKKLELPTECVKYDNNDESEQFCNIDVDIHNNKTPDWDKLSYDNRDKMYGKCEIDLKKHKKKFSHDDE